MSDMPLSTQAPSSTPAQTPIGRPLDLVVLFLFGIAALFVVQAIALAMFVAWLEPSHPDLNTAELLHLALQRAESNAFFAVPVQAGLYLLLALFIYLQVRRATRSSFWSGVAWRPVGRERALAVLVAGIALAVFVQLGNALFPPPEALPIDRLISTRDAALLVLGASLLVAPFFEELIFRGYLYSLLEPAWGVAPAVLVSGTLFGLLHVPQLLPGWTQIAFLCLVGIVFSLVRAKTGSLRASFLMHLGYNATLTLLYLISPEFTELPPTGTLLSWLGILR